MKRKETVFFGVCLAFFGFMLYEALGQIGRGRAGEVGSGFWPLLALSGCALLSGVRFIYCLRREGRESSRVPREEEQASGRPQVRHNAVIFTMAFFLAYLMAIPWIGFILATLLFVPSVSVSLGERRWGVLAVSPFVLTAVIVAVFAKFITIPFPRGAGLFAEFSRLFY